MTTITRAVWKQFEEYHHAMLRAGRGWGALDRVMAQKRFGDADAEACVQTAIDTIDHAGWELANILVRMSSWQRAKLAGHVTRYTAWKPADFGNAPNDLTTTRNGLPR